MFKDRVFLFAAVAVSSFVFFGITPASASGGESGTSTVQHFGIVFAMFVLVLLAGKLGSLVERFGQPAVIGELVFGIVLSACLWYLTMKWD